jgi:hypothetical protein
LLLLASRQRRYVPSATGSGAVGGVSQWSD